MKKEPNWDEISTVDEIIDTLMGGVGVGLVFREDVVNAIYQAIKLTDQRKPLTKEQAEAIIENHTYDEGGYDIWTDGMGIIRSVEAAHRIKE